MKMFFWPKPECRKITHFPFIYSYFLCNSAGENTMSMNRKRPANTNQNIMFHRHRWTAPLYLFSFSSQLVRCNATVRHSRSHWNGRKNSKPELCVSCAQFAMCDATTYHVNLPSFNCIYIESIMKRDEHCMRNHERLFIVPCIVVLLWSFHSFQFNSSNVLHDNILNSISHYHVLRTETETFGK